MITTQVQIVVELFNISVLDLTSATVHLQLRQLDLQTRGIRAADALHAATAIAFDADLLVSADDAILSLDGLLVNTQGRASRPIDNLTNLTDGRRLTTGYQPASPESI